MVTETVFTRRQFLAKAAAVSALATVQPVFAQNTTARSPHKFCAFTKPLQFLSFDELAILMQSLGFDGIEAPVRDRGHVLPEKVEEDLPRLHEALHKRGLEITVLTSGINSVASPHAEKVLRTAAKLGVKRYRMLWYDYDLEKPILPQLDAIGVQLNDLAALNRELGMTALYQNHAGNKMVGAPLWDIYSLLKELDAREVALAFDIRHATVEGGLSWPLQFNLVKSHLGAIFVKDFVWEDRKVKNMPLGEGVVDRKFFPMLKKAHFTGPISIHVEYLDRSRDPKVIGDAFRADLAKTKAWL